MRYFLIVCIGFLSTVGFSQQSTYWQQHVDYTMEIDVDVNNFQYKGTQKLVYTNNSPDSLSQVFYHLYFNAFQPGSEMDVRLQNIVDPDTRMVTNLGTEINPKYESRIAKLSPSEIGYLKVTSLKQNGAPVNHKTIGTILQVLLNKPILPNEKVVFEMDFEGQVPVHIRRAGRNSEDGIALSMAQWYPKMAEYDFEGWHATEYIAREFHGVWGNFNVTIHIDKNYTVGGTGILQNPDEVGHGYSNKLIKPTNRTKLSWHFVAENVHDFTWAADNEYVHDIVKTSNGTTLHFFYKNKEEYKQAWKEIQPLTAEALDYFNNVVGEYPYQQYSVMQGGDGGMEYAMCTLVAGGFTTREILGTVFHELAHSWFHHLLATNESKHSWMDEGFTTYISTLAYNKIYGNGSDKPSNKRYDSYYYAVKNNIEENLTTHADRFNTNTAFSIGSYTKGYIFVNQLNYIIGEKNLKTTLKKYFDDFKFKHPTPNDFKRVAEKVSGIQLDWYLNEWTQTTHTIDYAIADVKNYEITLARIGKMPMPIDVKVTYTDGTSEDFYIPLRMMFGEKPTTATKLNSWAWGFPEYSFTTKKEIQKVEIDPSGLMADIERENNVFIN